jgi:hypothetical protein
MTTRVTRSVWRRARSGSRAVIWIKATEHRPRTWSVCNSFWRLIRSTARPMKATPRRHPTLRLTPGAAQSRRAVQSATSCKLLLKLKELLVSRWWLQPVTRGRGVPPCLIRRLFMMRLTRPVRWLLAPIPLLASVAAGLSPGTAVDEQSLISPLRAPARARPVTPVTPLIPQPVARRWPLRILPAPWACCGALFQACATRSTPVAPHWITRRFSSLLLSAAQQVRLTTSMGGGGWTSRTL